MFYHIAFSGKGRVKTKIVSLRAQTEMIEYLDRVSPPNVLHWTLKDADDESIPFIDEIETLLVQSQTLIVRSSLPFSFEHDTVQNADRSWKAQDTHQPTSALPQLLRALHLTDSLSYSSLYLRALLLLIECRLAISPTISEAVRSEEEMEKVWTEILQTGGEGDQVEVLAKGWEMKGRCTIVRAQGKQGGIEAAGVALQESARREFSFLFFPDGCEQGIDILLSQMGYTGVQCMKNCKIGRRLCARVER